MVEESVDGDAVDYRLTGAGYRVSVFIDPTRFISLDFDLLRHDGSLALNYSIDTDMYDITRPKFAAFALDTETDIVLFLDALGDGRLLAEVRKDWAALVVPTTGGPQLVTRRRLWTTKKPFTAADMHDLAAFPRSSPWRG
jgi:hypothetical protein